MLGLGYTKEVLGRTTTMKSHKLLLTGMLLASITLAAAITDNGQLAVHADATAQAQETESITLSYTDMKGKVLQSKTYTGVVGTHQVVTMPKISGYVLQDDQQLELNFRRSGQHSTQTVAYAKENHIPISYVDAHGKVIKTTSVTVLQDDSKDVSAPVIKGYTAKDTATKEVEPDTAAVKFVYYKNGTLNVKYVNTKGKKVAKTEKIALIHGQYPVYFKPVKNYQLAQYLTNAQIKYTDKSRNVTIKYMKTTDVAKKANASFLKALNAYRKAHGLKTVKQANKVQKRATVRAKEQWKLAGHVRPNGTSYNSSNTGFAELYESSSLTYNKKAKLDFAAMGKNDVKRFLTLDNLHYRAIRTQSFKFGAGSYSFDKVGNAKLVVLFATANK